MLERIILSLLVIYTLNGCATADRGQLADVASTWAAISDGAVEANPLLDGLNIGEMAAVKLGVTQVVKYLPSEYCEPGLWALTAFGYGAAIWNIGVILGSGPAAIPVALFVIWTQKVQWLESSANTCAEPWHFEPVKPGFDVGWGF